MPELIKVAARVRPSARDGSDGNVAVLVNETQSQTEVNGRKYVFDAVFGKDSTQDAVFQSIAKPIIEGCVSGYNGTVFVYGQTGSGKTYTMLGAETEDGDLDINRRGLIPRSLEHLFDVLQKEQEKKSGSFNYTCRCCFVELYNEDLYDLLDESSNAKLKLRQTDTVEVEGVTEEAIMSCNDAIDVLMEGWKNRKVAETAMNRESSRSHAIFIVSLETVCEYNGVINRKRSRINLVDLAGSERQEHTKSSGARLKEAASINKSLSTLTRVIDRLSQNAIKQEHGHVPYRDSKLTHLLSDSLGGNARTAVIVNVHPDSRFVAQTVSTLKFAENVKHIENVVKVNEDLTTKDIEAWKAEILRLKEELRAKESFKPPQDKEINELTSQNLSLTQMLQDSQTRLGQLQNAYDVCQETNKIIMNCQNSENLPDVHELIQNFQERCLVNRNGEKTPLQSCDAVMVRNLKQDLRSVTKAKERLEIELEELKRSSKEKQDYALFQDGLNSSSGLNLSYKEKKERRRTRYTPSDCNPAARTSFFPVLEPLNNENSAPVMLDMNDKPRDRELQTQLEKATEEKNQIVEQTKQLEEKLRAFQESTEERQREINELREQLARKDVEFTEAKTMIARKNDETQRALLHEHRNETAELSAEISSLKERLGECEAKLSSQIVLLEVERTKFAEEKQKLMDQRKNEEAICNEELAARIAKLQELMDEKNNRIAVLESEKQVNEKDKQDQIRILEETHQRDKADLIAQHKMEISSKNTEYEELLARQKDQIASFKTMEQRFEEEKQALLDQHEREKTDLVNRHTEERCQLENRLAEKTDESASRLVSIKKLKAEFEQEKMNFTDRLRIKNEQHKKETTELLAAHRHEISLMSAKLEKQKQKFCDIDRGLKENFLEQMHNLSNGDSLENEITGSIDVLPQKIAEIEETPAQITKSETKKPTSRSAPKVAPAATAASDATEKRPVRQSARLQSKKT